MVVVVVDILGSKHRFYLPLPNTIISKTKPQKDQPQANAILNHKRKKKKKDVIQVKNTYLDSFIFSSSSTSEKSSPFNNDKKVGDDGRDNS